MRWTRTLIAFAAIVSLHGCNGSRTDSTAPQQPNVPPPSGALLFQPRFRFANGRTTQQGTGFLVEGNGETVGVTSVHFLDLEGPQMLSAEWLNIPQGDVAAEFKYSLGPPGHEGTTDPIDFRWDYLIVVGDSVPVDHVRLELDLRAKPDVGERVWFPNKNWDSDQGYTLVSGVVREASSACSLVVLDEAIELQSQSGSPVISQKTGKVIGTLAHGGSYGGSTSLILCPAYAIARVIIENPTRVPLKDAVGDPDAPAEEADASTDREVSGDGFIVTMPEACRITELTLSDGTASKKWMMVGGFGEAWIVDRQLPPPGIMEAAAGGERLVQLLAENQAANPGFVGHSRGTLSGMSA